MRRAAAPLLLALLLAALAHPALATAAWEAFGGRALAPFAGERLLALALAHASLCVAALVPAVLLGIGLGVAATRSWGGPLRALAEPVVAAAQATPPVVVVALAFPVLGFGAGPTIVALALYVLMPVYGGTVAALEAAPPEAREAAEAIGLAPWQVFREVEWALAKGAVLAALRVAVVLAVATAAVGALAGAATLGTPIVLGLQNRNELLILQGAAATAALAFLAEGALLLLAGRGTGLARRSS